VIIPAITVIPAMIRRDHADRRGDHADDRRRDRQDDRCDRRLIAATVAAIVTIPATIAMLMSMITAIVGDDHGDHAEHINDGPVDEHAIIEKTATIMSTIAAIASMIAAIGPMTSPPARWSPTAACQSRRAERETQRFVYAARRIAWSVLRAR
jgi:hypothetical protein